VFAEFGEESLLFKPTLISAPQFIHIGRKVSIRSGARLEAVFLDPLYPPEIRIGNNVHIEQDIQIGCVGRVKIADNVAIAPRCSIIGGFHPFFDVESVVPIKDRLAGARSSTEIGENSLIGIGTVIKLNVKIGKHVVVGPNSVVASNLPDFCFAEGNPATVLLKYDFATKRWVRPELSVSRQ
jgi:acetyltransferase-like isoleucine patch superfamily enzyme